MVADIVEGERDEGEAEEIVEPEALALWPEEQAIRRPITHPGGRMGLWDNGAELLLVGLKESRIGASLEHPGDLPGEVARVLNTGVQSETPNRCNEVGGITEQEDPALAKSLRHAVVHLVAHGPDDLERPMSHRQLKFALDLGVVRFRSLRRDGPENPPEVRLANDDQPFLGIEHIGEVGRAPARSLIQIDVDVDEHELFGIRDACRLDAEHPSYRASAPVTGQNVGCFHGYHPIGRLDREATTLVVLGQAHYFVPELHLAIDALRHARVENAFRIRLRQI